MMSMLFRSVFPYLVFALLLTILGWALRRWWRNSPRIGVPAWRSYVAVGAFGLATLSLLLWLILFAWAHVFGGFPFYDRVLMRFYCWGGFSGASGVSISLIGKS